MIYSILIGFFCIVFYFLLDILLTKIIDYKIYLFNLIRFAFIYAKQRIVLLVMRNRLFKRLRTSENMLPSTQVNSNGSVSDPDLGSFKMFEFVRIRITKKSEYSRLVDGSDLIEQGEHVKSGVPKKRSGHRCVCNQENLWIWGGYCPIEELSDNDNEDDDENAPSPSCIFPELWKFNFSTKRWSLLRTTGDVPTKTVASHGAVLHGNSTLVVFGGTGFPFGETLSNSLHICNLNTLVWKKYDLKGEVPLGLYGNSIVLIDDFLYILFGTNSREYCSNVYRVNIKTLESKKLFDSVELLENANFTRQLELDELYPDEFLSGRYRQEVVHYENKLYTFGGGKIDGDSYSLEILPAFNIQTNAWEFIQTHPDSSTNSFPEKRKFHSCHLIDNYIYLFGGIHTDVIMNIFHIVENCVWRLNMLDLKWTKMEQLKMPVLTYFHASCANNNGQIYFHGGVRMISERNQKRINHLYTILLKVPKLTDICWTKLVTNYPKVLTLQKKTLCDLGVPANFIKRIN